MFCMKKCQTIQKIFYFLCFSLVSKIFDDVAVEKSLYVKIDNIHIDKLTYKQQNGDMKIYVDVSPIYLISYKKYPHIYQRLMHCTTKIL